MTANDLYNYKANVVRIIDGDTIVVSIDLGYSTWRLNQHCRLYGINTPETKGETRVKGIQATNHLRSIMQETIYMHSHGIDAFGRWLVTIHNPNTQESINSLMLSSSHAIPF